MTVFMSVSMMLFGVYCHYQGTIGHNDKYYHQLPLLLFGIFFFCFAIGPYRLTWYFVEKIVPCEYYFTMRCFLVSFNWLVISGVTRVLPMLIDTIGIGWIFWYISLMCAFASLFYKYGLSKLKVLKSSEERKLVTNCESNNEHCDN